jgi:hypothetical protein
MTSESVFSLERVSFSVKTYAAPPVSALEWTTRASPSQVAVATILAPSSWKAICFPSVV